ncbi:MULTISPECIES: helix-turn-helix domain-containing protein [Staphylococcus]|uniref:Helix-turn-helix transcriptional regulator n=1 Tax=Staphylococcus hsinchuensis TaxID=3051183 RepID=A0ABZ3EE83_9STAP|nr:helix-turn-helix transcriptional regulator [Staphylococcus sp. Marseille-Q6910]
MNLGTQIKKYREKNNLSQEDLAEKMYISRQTVSNWENDRSYPDVHNLLLLSSIFDVSLDNLVKGDLEIMEKKLNQSHLKFWTYLMLITFLLGAVLLGPAIMSSGNLGMLFIVALFIVGMCASFKVEKIKKDHNIETYDKIVAYMNGENPNNVQSTERRNKLTFTLSFIGFVGTIIIIALISIYLSNI